MNTFYIRTFGCQMNNHDSERMAQLLVMQGLRPVDSPREADLVIINTCSVRAKPEHKALSEAGRHRQRKQAKGTRILLTGCVAQQEGDRLLSKAPYLDAIIGPDAVGRLPEILASIQAGNGPVIAVDLHDQQNPCFVPLREKRRSQISSLVTIMKGCDNYCSYCVVPHVRGREVSRPLGDILKEVEQLAAGGTREVVLLGQNVNSYHDPLSGTGFPDLLAALDRQGAVDRIRFTTSHPKDLGPRLVEAMAGLERVCEHIHLALQSGSDRILELMNRNYSAADFIGKAEAIRQAMPGVSITTDIIVGFPSESDEDFQNTMATVRSVAFDQAFSFKYSPRPGTAAAKLADDVSPEVKAGRLAVLQTVLDELEAASLSRLSGQALPVLVEGQSIRDPDALRGRTRCNRVVNFACSSPVPAGKTVEVRVVEARGHTLWGETGVDIRPMA
jgi:tRNA-2-methylthio-N6-dimethylallyladenosine synthase